MGLRYDLTVPFSKCIALNKNDITFPFKRYEIAKVFRDGPIKAGRDREFTQCDIDVVGIDGQLIEAELISLYVEGFSRLDIEVVIKYNSRNLMIGLIKECDIEENLINQTVTIIDKIEKLSREDFNKALSEIGVTSEKTQKLLDLFSKDLETLIKEYSKSNNEDLVKGIKELSQLNKYLKQLNLMKYCEFSSSLARGQDYYTGNVFEVYEKNGKLSCSIGGGGRYDKIITNFIDDGNSYPAVGVSFGLTALYEILKDKPYFENESLIDVYIIPINTEIESLKLANSIRKLGLKVDLEMSDRKLRKSLNYANKQNIKYVIVLGEDEIKNGKFILKDMNANNEYDIDINNIDFICSIIEKNKFAKNNKPC